MNKREQGRQNNINGSLYEKHIKEHLKNNYDRVYLWNEIPMTWILIQMISQY